jgi:pimeloyl-ACP methyl ester carboxylesterase
VQEFAGEYELVAMDMRGYGGSDAPKASHRARMQAHHVPARPIAYLPTRLLP